MIASVVTQTTRRGKVISHPSRAVEQGIIK
jgi:hypothetical protein